MLCHFEWKATFEIVIKTNTLQQSFTSKIDIEKTYNIVMPFKAIRVFKNYFKKTAKLKVLTIL